MEQRMIKRLLSPLLVLCLLAALVVPSGFHTPVFAGTQRSLSWNNADGDVSKHWDYGDNLAGGDITEKSKEISNTVTVTFNDQERALANEGFLTYSGSCHFGANGSRTVEPRLKIVCYDASGSELSVGKYEKSTSTYWVSHANYDYSSGNVTIPQGTAKIQYQASVDIGTSGSLELERMTFSISSSMPENSYRPISDEIGDIELYQAYDKNGQGSGPVTTYYDLFKDSAYRLDLSESQSLYKAALLNQDNLNHWIQLAYQIYRSNGKTYWDWEGGGFEKDFGQGVYMDLIRDLANKVIRTHESKIKTESTGLCIAKSFDDAIYQIMDGQARLRSRNADVNDFLARHGDISLGSDEADSAEQLVFYTAVSTNDQYGGTYKYGYNTMGLVFYDFAITPLIDENPFVTTAPNVVKPTTQTSVSTQVNKSLKDTEFSQSVGTSVETSTTNTIENSSSTTRTNAVGAELSFSEKFGIADSIEDTLTFSMGYDFSVSEAFSVTETDSTSHTETYSDTTTTNITVPAHTQANIATTTDKAQVTLDYDCPVGISYKVAIISMCGSYYDDNAAILDMTSADYNHRSFITVFGKDQENAAKNLRQRAENRMITGNDSLHGHTVLSGMDEGRIASELWWNEIYTGGKPSRSQDTSGFAPTLYTAKDLILLMGSNEPMSVTGASIDTVSNMTTTYLENIQPLKPLKKIWVTKIKVQLKANTIQVPVGGDYYLIDITVDGFDEEDVPYHGFQQTLGHWEVLDDATGEPLSPSIAEITTSKTTGKSKLSVYQAYDGIVLKYIIPEDVYKAVGQEQYTTNEDLMSTAYVDVVVSGEPAVKQEFEDVPEDAWYADSVDFMENQGYMEGTGESSFSPDQESSRAVIATVLWRMANSEDPKVQSKFQDLKQSWYEKAVNWAAENGIANGTGESTFTPDGSITREQLVTFLYRFAEKQGRDVSALADLTEYGDADQIAEYAKEAFQWAVEEGILSGKPDQTLDPKGTASRAEIATVLSRYL